MEDKELLDTLNARGSEGNRVLSAIQDPRSKTVIVTYAALENEDARLLGARVARDVLDHAPEALDVTLRGMRKGDPVLYYHSGEDRAVVGVAKVLRSAYPDPTASEGDWVAVDIAPVKPLGRPVSLAEIKADPVLADLPLLRQSRLSVMPVSAASFRRILALAKTRL